MEMGLIGAAEANMRWAVKVEAVNNGSTLFGPMEA